MRPLPSPAHCDQMSASHTCVTPWFHSNERKAVRAAPRTWLGLGVGFDPNPHRSPKPNPKPNPEQAARTSKAHAFLSRPACSLSSRQLMTWLGLGLGLALR